MDLFRDEVLDARKQSLFDDVVLDQPLPIAILSSFMAAISVSAIIYAVLGVYSRTETVPGYVASETASAQIFALRPGVVTALHVADGDTVRAGQAIGTVRIGQANAESADPLADAQKSITRQMQTLQTQSQLETQRMTSERSKQRSALAGLSSTLNSIESQIVLQRDIVSSSRNTVTQLEQLLPKGFTSKFEVERRRGESLAAQQQLEQLNQQRAQITAQISGLRNDIARLPIDLQSKSGELDTEMQNLRQRLSEGSSAREYVITAPISGRVSALQTGIGRLANPGLPLMSILPDGAELGAELLVPSRAAGFVRKGQRVRLLYEAFPYQRFGSFGGTIARVSRTVLTPEQIDAPLKLAEPVYRLHVRLDAQGVRAFGEQFALQPGMTLTAHIQLERRSFIDWFLEPLRAVQARSS
jgi:membrane fusion protein